MDRPHESHILWYVYNNTVSSYLLGGEITKCIVVSYKSKKTGNMRGVGVGGRHLAATADLERDATPYAPLSKALGKGKIDTNWC